MLKTLVDNMGFEYVICDSPAGIEQGALMALYFADEAIVTTNPEVSSVRDSDRIWAFYPAKPPRRTRRSTGTRAFADYPLFARAGGKSEILSVEDICDILRIPLLGVIPESQNVLQASTPARR